MFGPNGPFAAGGLTQIRARYWRFVSITDFNDFWDLTDVAAAGIFEEFVSGGTDIGATLVATSTMKFFDPSNVDVTSTAFSGNPFDGSTTGRIYTSGNDGNPGYKFWLDFTTAKTIGCVIWYGTGGAGNRQPLDMNLQYSHNNSTWVQYALLNNPSQHVTSYFRGIRAGGIVAAASS